jgi:hypothetical protein
VYPVTIVDRLEAKTEANREKMRVQVDVNQKVKKSDQEK